MSPPQRWRGRLIGKAKLGATVGKMLIPRTAREGTRELSQESGVHVSEGDCRLEHGKLSIREAWLQGKASCSVTSTILNQQSQVGERTGQRDRCETSLV